MSAADDDSKGDRQVDEEGWAIEAGRQTRGEGVVPAIDHLLTTDLAAQGLTRLPVRGAPIEDMWHAITVTPERRSLMASRLLRFLASPDALMAMHHAGSGVPAARFRPPIHVTIWS